MTTIYTKSKSKSKEMSLDLDLDLNINIKLSVAITIWELIDNNQHRVNDAVTKAVNDIQNAMNISQLPARLHRIFNNWGIREWNHDDGVPKFVHCLRKIVTRELKRRVFDHLAKESVNARYPISPIPDEEDLYYALRTVWHVLALGNWSTMDNNTMISELCLAVSQWIRNHNEQICDDVSNTFRWVDIETMEVCYHLPHLPKPVVINAAPVLSSLETLPSNFQHKTDWTCSICLEVNALLVCVRTACKHVFHRSCFGKWKKVFLVQAENDEKTCCLCPLCRAVIN